MFGIFLIIISITLTTILYLFSKIDNPRNIDFLILLVQATGLLASLLMSWNFILATRLRIIEKIFNGLDKVYKIHNLLGNFAFILALNHPIFLLISSLPYNSINIYLVPSLSNIPYALGIISLYLLIIFVSLTIFIDLPYKLWKKTHECIGLVILFSSIHSILVSSDISFYLPLKIWMIFLNSIAIIAYVYKRFLYYIFLPKNNYKIENITQEKDYLLLELVATNIDNKLVSKSGQFVFISREVDTRDEHPFSILENVDDRLKLGAKIVGPFTISLSKLKKGDSITIYGPYGSFSESLDKVKKAIFISGGIGITPFLSMMKEKKSHQEFTLIHSSRSSEPKLFTNLFSEFNVVLYNSEIKGRLNYLEIKKYIKDLDSDYYIFMCGPKPMMEDIATNLVKNGLNKKRIVFEDFTFK